MSEKGIKILNRISITILLVIVVIAIFVMANGIGTEGKDYGPGAYYYTDIPGWEEIFYPGQSNE